MLVVFSSVVNGYESLSSVLGQTVIPGRGGLIFRTPPLGGRLGMNSPVYWDDRWQDSG